MSFKKFLNRPTPDIAHIAKKHGVSEDYVARQLEAGIKVEMEHTKVKAVAREIAQDHLSESPHYYVELAKMEKKLDNE